VYQVMSVNFFLVSVVTFAFTYLRKKNYHIIRLMDLKFVLWYRSGMGLVGIILLIMVWDVRLVDGHAGMMNENRDAVD